MLSTGLLDRTQENSLPKIHPVTRNLSFWMTGKQTDESGQENEKQINSVYVHVIYWWWAWQRNWMMTWGCYHSNASLRNREPGEKTKASSCLWSWFDKYVTQINTIVITMLQIKTTHQPPHEVKGQWQQNQYEMMNNNSFDWFCTDSVCTYINFCNTNMKDNCWAKQYFLGWQK